MSKENVKKYIQYYIGHVRFRYRYVDYEPAQWSVWVMMTHERYARAVLDKSIVEVQIELRKLESMTEEEMIEMIKYFSKIDLSHCAFEFSEDDSDNHAWVNAIENWQVVDCLDINLFDHTVMMMDDYGEVTITLPQSETFVYLLSKGFDLFNLIENGLAIDKDTIKQ